MINLVYIAALLMIWIAWGFWAPVIVLIATVILGFILQPRYNWQMNWGFIIAKLATLIAGVYAVNYVWHEPVYTVAALLIVLFVLFSKR